MQFHLASKDITSCLLKLVKILYKYISNQCISYQESLKIRTIICILALKHKDSFGKSENLSKIFFAEILVFDHDYEASHRAVMVCSESLLFF